MTQRTVNVSSLLLWIINESSLTAGEDSSGVGRVLPPSVPLCLGRPRCACDSVLKIDCVFVVLGSDTFQCCGVRERGVALGLQWLDAAFPKHAHNISKQIRCFRNSRSARTCKTTRIPCSGVDPSIP